MKSAGAVTRIFTALERHHPGADTELHHRNAFELLVATILSAQSTDARVNLVTPVLFARFPDARSLMRADTAELEELIHATGFFRQKSRSLVKMAEMLVAHHDGNVPASMDALTALPGVGRKTANVVLGHALGVPGLPVDRHVLRVANRLGLVHSDDPVKVEAALGKMLPPERWTRASDELILHGRRICRPTPLCPECLARPDCDFVQKGVPAHKKPRQGKPKGLPPPARSARPAPLVRPARPASKKAKKR
jgi:endonuclease-3